MAHICRMELTQGERGCINSPTFPPEWPKLTKIRPKTVLSGVCLFEKKISHHQKMSMLWCGSMKYISLKICSGQRSRYLHAITSQSVQSSCLSSTWPEFSSDGTLWQSDKTRTHCLSPLSPSLPSYWWFNNAWWLFSSYPPHAAGEKGGSLSDIINNVTVLDHALGGVEFIFECLLTLLRDIRCPHVKVIAM